MHLPKTCPSSFVARRIRDIIEDVFKDCKGQQTGEKENDLYQGL